MKKNQKVISFSLMLKMASIIPWNLMSSFSLWLQVFDVSFLSRYYYKISMVIVSYFPTFFESLKIWVTCKIESFKLIQNTSSVIPADAKFWADFTKFSRLFDNLWASMSILKHQFPINNGERGILEFFSVSMHPKN